MSDIDWLDTPLESFISILEEQENGKYRDRQSPFGEGRAQSLLMSLAATVEDAYAQLIAFEDSEGERFEEKGEVPVIRDGRRVYEPLDKLTLRDLPVILDTLVVLEEEHKEREREEAERVHAERKKRDRVRAKERRKLKKLGEW
jgi:hypothetical protein